MTKHINTLAKPLYARIAGSAYVHDLHKYVNRTECRKSTDSTKVAVKAFIEFPDGGEPCPECQQAVADRLKAREQEKLHRAYERTQDLAARGPQRKNTAGKKQVFNRTSDKFSMD